MFLLTKNKGKTPKKSVFLVVEPLDLSGSYCFFFFRPFFVNFFLCGTGGLTRPPLCAPSQFKNNFFKKYILPSPKNQLSVSLCGFVYRIHTAL